jgi:diaminohydroxyphosphoribosylaminopyrimidine deaminase/5-amino-6-(5-phosphoribosylamino)uracil reductase
MATHFSDEHWMDEALRLARKGAGWTNPNPMVGAILVKKGRVIARGFHHRVGGLHAEAQALRVAKSNLHGATLYVNLEPCSHVGRTPPCAEAIIRAGITRVVCSTRDPNPLVAGRGIALLRRAGITVSIGLRAKEARALNEAFFMFHEKHRPFIGIKFAASLDGKLATRTGDSKWITNPGARTFARSIRSEYQAVLVGIRTVLLDDPHLGARKKNQKDPLRIVLDPHLRIPGSAKVLRDSNVLVVALLSASLRKKEQLEKRGATVALLPGKSIVPQTLFAEMRKREIISILVEGGGDTIGRFLDWRIVDRVYAFYAPILVGGKDALGIAGTGIQKIEGALRLKNPTVKMFGDNMLLSGSVIR